MVLLPILRYFKNIPNYLFESPNPEYELGNAPDYSPYYFRFWFDGDKEKTNMPFRI